MIRLRPDCLVFDTPTGESIPAGVDQIVFELVGETVPFVDETILKNAAYAVLHYFKEDLGKEHVTLPEFASALEQALRGLGLNVQRESAPPTNPRVAEADLRQLAGEASDGLELLFFPRLRDELRRQLGHAPQVLRFRGLCGCVKMLIGAKRWSPRCQGLQDQIVEFLRTCLSAENRGQSCALVVQ